MREVCFDFTTKSWAITKLKLLRKFVKTKQHHLGGRVVPLIVPHQIISHKQRRHFVDGGNNYKHYDDDGER